MKKLLSILFIYLNFYSLAQGPTLIKAKQLGDGLGTGSFVVTGGANGSMTYAAQSSILAPYQPSLNGTGFVKTTGTVISYDNSTYLTTSSASSVYFPYSGATSSATTQYAISTPSLYGPTSTSVINIFSNPNGSGTINLGSGTGTVISKDLFHIKLTNGSSDNSGMIIENLSNTGFGSSIHFKGTLSSSTYTYCSLQSENNSTGGLMRFLTSNTSGVLTTRGLIDANGYWAVGPITPTFNLHVGRSNTDAANTTSIVNSYYVGVGKSEFGVGSYKLIGIGYCPTNTNNYPSYIGYQEKSSTSKTKGDLIFGTRNITTDTEPTQRLRIFAEGNVTIGTTTTAPSATLDVTGTFSASSTSSLNGLQLVSGGYSVTSKGINTTTGDAATINSPIGRFRKDNSGATFTLTNSQITANSIIVLTAANAAIDATATGWTISAGAGSATITFNAAPSADFDMNFMIMN